MFHGESNVTLRNNCPERSWRTACADNKRVNCIQYEQLPQQRQQRQQRQEITSEATHNIAHVIMLYTFRNSHENLRHFHISEEILILNVTNWFNTFSS